MFAEAHDEAEAVSRILARGVKGIVLKRGAAGASYFNEAGEIRRGERFRR